MNQTLEVRDTLVWLADEPPIPNPERKDALSQTALWLVGDGMRGGICGFTAAVADAGVCARARAAVKARSQVRKSGTPPHRLEAHCNPPIHQFLKLLSKVRLSIVSSD